MHKWKCVNRKSNNDAFMLVKVLDEQYIIGTPFELQGNIMLRDFGMCTQMYIHDGLIATNKIDWCPGGIIEPNWKMAIFTMMVEKAE